MFRSDKHSHVQEIITFLIVSLKYKSPVTICEVPKKADGVLLGVRSKRPHLSVEFIRLFSMTKVHAHGNRIDFDRLSVIIKRRCNDSSS